MGGKDFSGSVVPLMLAVPAILFSSLNIALGNELIADSREREWAILNVIGFTCSVVYAITFIYFFWRCWSCNIEFSNRIDRTCFAMLARQRIYTANFATNRLPQDWYRIRCIGIYRFAAEITTCIHSRIHLSHCERMLFYGNILYRTCSGA